MNVLEVLPIEVAEKAILEFVSDASLLEALRALNTCSTFRNIINHYIIVQMPRMQFRVSPLENNRIAEHFLDEHLELLLMRRSKSQNAIQWAFEPLFKILIEILELEGCSIRDDRGKAFEANLMRFLVTSARSWTVKHLQKTPKRLRSPKFRSMGVLCTAVMTGSLKAVKKIIEPTDTARNLVFKTRFIDFDIEADDDGKHQQPVLVAISAGEPEILQFLLSEKLWHADPDDRLDDNCVYHMLQFAIKEKNPQATAVLHDQLVRRERYIFTEDQYFYLVELAAMSGDATTFRTIVHLLATNIENAEGDSDNAQTYQDVYEDVIRENLKQIILHPSEPEDSELSVRKGYSRCLIQSIIIAYNAILKKTDAHSRRLLMAAIDEGDSPKAEDSLNQCTVISIESLCKEDCPLCKIQHGRCTSEECKNDETKPERGKDTLICPYSAYEATFQQVYQNGFRTEWYAKEAEKAVPVWKEIHPSKRDVADRDPLWFERAMEIVRNQAISVYGRNVKKEKKENHAISVCGMSTPINC